MTTDSVDGLVRQVAEYADSMCEEPADFPVHARFLGECSPDRFVRAFKDFRRIFVALHRDAASRPTEYGLARVDKPSGQPVRTDQKPSCIYDLIVKVSRSATIHGDELVVDLGKFRALLEEFPETKHIQKLLGRFSDFGFELVGYDGKSRLDKVSDLKVRHRANPDIIHVIAAFAQSRFGRLQEDFDYKHLNWKVFALGEGERLSLEDLYVFGILSDSDKRFMRTFNDAMSQMGYGYGDGPSDGFCWGTSQFVYTKVGLQSKDVVCRVYQRGNNLVPRLFLKNVDAYSDYVEDLPASIKEPFTGEFGACKRCKEVCRFRKSYTVGGVAYDKCDGVVFEFPRPRESDVPYLVELLRLSLSARKRRAQQ